MRDTLRRQVAVLLANVDRELAERRDGRSPLSEDLLLAIDQGTTSTRAIAFDRSLRPVASSSIRLETAHPAPGWVEQDPEAIVDSVVLSVARVLEEVGGPERIVAAGLANQGETVVAWDAEDRRALAPAIGWQCRRSLPIVERLRARGTGRRDSGALGPAARPLLLRGQARLAARAQRRSAHGVGPGSAALRDGGRLADGASGRGRRTNGHIDRVADATSGPWRARPGIETSSAGSGSPRQPCPGWSRRPATSGSWLIHGGGGALALRAMACDQQAALAGHGAFAPGAIKATYGTGVFVLANAGGDRDATAGLETSIAWTLPGDPTSADTTAIGPSGRRLCGRRDDRLAARRHGPDRRCLRDRRHGTERPRRGRSEGAPGAGGAGGAMVAARSAGCRGRADRSSADRRTSCAPRSMASPSESPTWSRR